MSQYNAKEISVRQLAQNRDLIKQGYAMLGPHERCSFIDYEQRQAPPRSSRARDFKVLRFACPRDPSATSLIAGPEALRVSGGIYLPVWATDPREP